MISISPRMGEMMGPKRRRRGQNALDEQACSPRDRVGNVVPERNLRGPRTANVEEGGGGRVAIEESEGGRRGSDVKPVLSRQSRGLVANSDRAPDAPGFRRIPDILNLSGVRIQPSAFRLVSSPREKLFLRKTIEPKLNPFDHPRAWRQRIIDHAKLEPAFTYNGKAFICALINSRCPVGCAHCMFGSNMTARKDSVNTMTGRRVGRLMKLVRDSNTGYLLVSGGGEGFLEPELMYQIAEETAADVTWMVTSAYWARNKKRAVEVVRRLHDAYLRGKHLQHNRKVCLRMSFDSYHVDRIARPGEPPLQYVVDLVKMFETEYAHEDHFVLMLHSLEGEEALVDGLCEALSGTKFDRHDPLHDDVKVTERAITIKLESGYEFEVTFAKLLLSDLAADLRDKGMLKRKVEVFEEDAFRNERGYPAIKYNADGTIGPNMLVIYNGRVSGGWQSEMPDVPLNIDSDDFEDIMRKTLSDPGVLGTVEYGLRYRFDVIGEVCPKAVLRAKAVNIRDYTSPVLLEEDKVKLYYSIRVLQDYIARSRIAKEEFARWPEDIRRLVSLSKRELQDLYHEAKYDIVQQFMDNDRRFKEFIRYVRLYVRDRDPENLLEFWASNPGIEDRIVDKWRLLLARIARDWYEVRTLNNKEIDATEEVARIMDEKILGGRRIHEGLSSP